MTKGARVVGYTRVSTVEQGDSGLGLEAQEAQIRAECERRGWELVGLETDVQSGKSLSKRPALARALAACRRREVDGIVASKLDRISRSTIDFVTLLEDARKRGYNVVVLDLGVDLQSPMGEAMVTVACAFAQLERRVIGERTKAALAVAKKRGTKSGKPIGRPAHRFDETLRRKVKQARRAGLSWSVIARQLEQEGVRTADGKTTWHARQVQRLVA